jgi:hypothetical protein
MDGRRKIKRTGEERYNEWGKEWALIWEEDKMDGRRTSKMGRRGNNDWMRKEIDCKLEVRQAVWRKLSWKRSPAENDRETKKENHTSKHIWQGETASRLEKKVRREKTARLGPTVRTDLWEHFDWCKQFQCRRQPRSNWEQEIIMWETRALTCAKTGFSVATLWRFGGEGCDTAATTAMDACFDELELEEKGAGWTRGRLAYALHVFGGMRASVFAYGLVTDCFLE